MRRGKKRYSLMMEIFLILFTFSVISPILYIISVSFSKIGSMYSSSIIPQSFTLDNYRYLFMQTKFLTWMKNSTIISLITMVLIVPLTAVSAYIFSRFNFYGKKCALKGLFLLMLFPATLSMVAIYRILQMLGLINSITGLIIVYIGLSINFSLWLMKGYFDSIPMDVEEAALIDGANRAKVFAKIIFPLIKPILAVVAINIFIATYGEYALSSVIITGDKNYTVALGLRTYLEGGFGVNWPVFTAGALISALPILILFYLMQNYFISSMLAGAIKQ